MSTFNSRRVRVLLLGLCVAAGGIYAARQPSAARAAPAEAPEARPAVVTLRQERVATLQSARDIADRMFASGIGKFEQVERMSRLLVDAQLALATTQKERADILNNAIKDAQKQEAMSEQRVKSGAATALESLEAKAHRLGLEIRLSEEGAEKGPGR